MGIRSEWGRTKRFRKGVIPGRLTPAKMSRASASRNPFKPNVIIEIDHHRVTGYGKKVLFPKNFDGIFKRGERILYWHLESTNMHTILKLLQKMYDPKTQAELKALGFAGFVGDVPNEKLRELYERHGAKLLKAKPPFLIALRERLRYAQNVVKRKYPAKNMFDTFERVALRFE